MKRYLDNGAANAPNQYGVFKEGHHYMSQDWVNQRLTGKISVWLWFLSPGISKTEIDGVSHEGLAPPHTKYWKGQKYSKFIWLCHEPFSHHLKLKVHHLKLKLKEVSLLSCSLIPLCPSTLTYDLKRNIIRGQGIFVVSTFDCMVEINVLYAYISSSIVPEKIVTIGKNM